LLGCIVARKAHQRLAGFSLRWFQLVGPLAVLVGTSMIAIVLRLILLVNPLEADLRRALVFCLVALLMIGVVTIANLVLLVVRSRQTAEVP